MPGTLSSVCFISLFMKSSGVKFVPTSPIFFAEKLYFSDKFWGRISKFFTCLYKPSTVGRIFGTIIVNLKKGKHAISMVEESVPSAILEVRFCPRQRYLFKIKVNSRINVQGSFLLRDPDNDSFDERFGFLCNRCKCFLFKSVV